MKTMKLLRVIGVVNAIIICLIVTYGDIFRVIVHNGVSSFTHKIFMEHPDTKNNISSVGQHSVLNVDISSVVQKNIPNKKSAICSNITRRDLGGLASATATWQNVSSHAPENLSFLVYSAFWETRLTPPAVRIIGLVPTRSTKYTYMCTLWYTGQDQPEFIKATKQYIGRSASYKWVSHMYHIVNITHQSTLHEITSHHTTPHQTGQHHNTPHHTRLQPITPHYITPDYNLSHHITPHPSKSHLTS